MKSIERRFNNIKNRRPNWSSYICFAEAIKGQKITKDIISRWFGKLVEKDDYSKKDKKQLLKHLDVLSNTSGDD